MPSKYLGEEVGAELTTKHGNTMKTVAVSVLLLLFVILIITFFILFDASLDFMI